jgi:hypothetical protein
VSTIAEIAVFLLILTVIAFVRLRMVARGDRGESGGCGCGGHGDTCKRAARPETEDGV